MSKGCRLAIIGATGEVGRAFLSVLEDAGLELAEVHAVASSDSAEETVMYRGRALLVEALDEFDFKRADVAVLAVPEAVARACVPKAEAAACRLIDHSAASRFEVDVPLVLAGEGADQAALVACPDALAATLAPLLRVLAPYGLVQVTVTALCPVSSRGRAGVRELAGQTGELLNARGIEPAVFPVQVAFNALPVVGESMADDLMDQLERLLPEPVPVVLSAVHVPVFYGYSLALTVHTRSAPALESVREACGAAGFIFPDSEAEQGVATPVTDASGQDGLYLSALAALPAPLIGLKCWLLADNVRQGAAVHSLAILKNWIKDFKY